jgi:hypothetical protein
MFDTLTETETSELHLKLYSGGRKFAQVNHTLTGVAQAVRAEGGDDNPIWAQRLRFSAAMHETYEMMRMVG